MTRSPRLGPMLATAGGALALAAVVTGFVVIGGPGDARDRRLDDAAMSRIENAIATAQCALNVTGAAPASIEEANQIRPAPTETAPTPPTCGDAAAERGRLTTGDRPVAPGDVVYRAIDLTNIRICANFRRPRTDRDNDRYYGPLAAAYPQLSAPRPAGVHCYDIKLAKGGSLTDVGGLHVGHIDAFE